MDTFAKYDEKSDVHSLARLLSKSEISSQATLKVPPKIRKQWMQSLSPSPAKGSLSSHEKDLKNDAGGDDRKPVFAAPVVFIHKKEERSLTSARTTQLLAAKHLLYRNEGGHLHRAAFFGDERALVVLIDEIRRVKGVQGGAASVKKALETRMSKMRLTVLSYAVLGARNLPAIVSKFLRPELSCRGNWKACVEIIFACCCNVNSRGVDGNPVLSLACKACNWSI